MLVAVDDDPVVSEILARLDDDFEAWERQVAATGYCEHPVRLQGRIDQVDRATGEAREIYSTEGEVDRTLLKACGNRRESRCASCAALKQADAYHLVIAGLAGGKGIPDTVATHPKLFVTLTAPSFGAVHSRVTKGERVLPCRPRGKAACCSHGRLMECRQRHREDDPCLGEPICQACFDYEGQVLWNALAPELWRRLTDYTKRALAQAVGITVGELCKTVRLSFLKAAEGQRRGAVHFHAIFRLDAAPPEDDPEAVAPPPGNFSARMLEDAIRWAAGTVTAPHPRISPQRLEGFVRFGTQIDIRNISADGPGELNAKAVALYVGKYATKSTGGLKALDHRLSENEVAALQERDHVMRLVRTAWLLGGRPGLEDLGLRRWAHQFGFGGHWHTKSRRFSTTFGALQRARNEHVRRSRTNDGVALDAWGRPEDEDQVVVVAEWKVAGFGWQSEGEAALALSAAARARERRQGMREQRYWTTKVA